MSFPPNQTAIANQANLSTNLTGTDASGNGDGIRKHSQIIAVEIKGCMNGFHLIGPDAATWRPVEGKHAQIFGLDGVDTPGMAAEAVSGDMSNPGSSLRNVNITKATLLQSHNTFDVPLGVTVNCLPKMEAVDTGDRYTFTTIPRTSVNVPQVLFEAGESQTEAEAWRTAFPTFTSKNLDTQGVLALQNCPYVFVNENHPAINLLRMNQGVLGVNIDEVCTAPPHALSLLTQSSLTRISATGPQDGR